MGLLEPSRTVTGGGGVPEPGTDPPPDRICMIMREASPAGSRRRRGIRERTPRPSAARAAREPRAASGPQAGEPPRGPFEGGRHPSRPRDPRPGRTRAGSPPRRGEALGAQTRDGARVAGGCSQLLAGTRCAPSLRAAFGRHRRGPGTGPSVPARGPPRAAHRARGEGRASATPLAPAAPALLAPSPLTAVYPADNSKQVSLKSSWLRASSLCPRSREFAAGRGREKKRLFRSENTERPEHLFQQRGRGAAAGSTHTYNSLLLCNS